MNNHESHQQPQHQQSTQADFYGYSFAPHQPPTSIIHRPPATSFGSVASTGSSTSTASKRGRDDDGRSSISPACNDPQQIHPAETIQQQQQQQYTTPKRARPSNYQVPREAKPSFLSAMGTLANPAATNRATTSFLSAPSTTVPMRRRLSGGHLEQYLANHDAMDMEGSDSRQRSMSF